MDKEDIKNEIDLNNIQEKEFTIISHLNITEKYDYLVDSKGNFIIRLTPLDMKLIETIKNLEERIKELETKIL